MAEPAEQAEQAADELGVVGATQLSKRARLALSAVGLASGSGVFLLQANHAQLPHGALYGFLLLFGVLLGLFAALGLLATPHDATPLAQTAWGALPGEAWWAAPRITAPLALAIVVVAAFSLGGHALPYFIVGALLLLLVSALSRPGLFVFVAVSLLYLPLLGSYGLWDPWETHYGEVTREILARDDWISLWWAQDKWFWSKPILIFWSEALAWSAAGIGFRADSHPAHTEWVLRLPIFAMAMTALLAVYGAVARSFSKRAGVLAALVLATTPYYAMLTHQAITDLPFVANMTVAVMLLVVALVEDPERRAGSVRIGPWAFSLQHVVIALVVMIALPQILYLASRNLTLVGGTAENPLGLFAWHRDDFMFGSAGNRDVPGNFGIRTESPHVRALVLQPLGQALGWLAALCALVAMLRRERRLAHLYMFAFYVFCALAFMAKGIPGFALPGLVAALCLLATGRFSLLLSGQLRVAAGMLVVITLGMPWFVAMYMRHGPAFTDRILIHDHINRLTSGVHGDNGTIQYFIAQLGYGLFPWIALLPAALMLWLVEREREPEREAPAPQAAAQRVMFYAMGLWFAAAFTLFSAMTTKFHHYIFPAVPPAAALTGVLLDRMLGGSMTASRKRTLAAFGAALLSACALALGIAGLHGDARGILPDRLAASARATWVFSHPWPTTACLLFVAGAVMLFVFVVRVMRSGASLCPRSRDDRYAEAAIAVAMFAGALLLSFVGRDLSWNAKDQPPGSERLIHLFVYNYTRPWPDALDYRAILMGFASAGVLLTLACAVRAFRRAAVLSLVGLGCAITVWSLDVYMIDLAPHWGQAELIDRYYRERKSDKEPLVAWQMNWKGENFYTGNRVAVFVELDNKKIEAWIKAHAGTRSFFVLEHGRLDRLKRMLNPREVQVLSTKRECNKFVLVRAKL